MTLINLYCTKCRCKVTTLIEIGWKFIFKYCLVNSITRGIFLQHSNHCYWDPHILYHHDLKYSLHPGISPFHLFPTVSSLDDICDEYAYPLIISGNLNLLFLRVIEVGVVLSTLLFLFAIWHNCISRFSASHFNLAAIVQLSLLEKCIEVHFDYNMCTKLNK